MKKMKHKKKTKISFAKIISLLLLIVSVLLVLEVVMIDILPTKYFVALVGVISLINFGSIFLSFKKSKKKKLKRVMTGFSVFFIIAFSAVLVYLYKTSDFLDSIEATGFKVENYSVIVKESSNYKKLKDISGLSVGYYEKTTGAKKANKKLGSKVDVTFSSYDDYNELVKDLLNEDNSSDDVVETSSKEKNDSLNVMVIEDSIFSMIKEEIPEFEKNTRVIYRFKIITRVKDSVKDVNVTSSAFNIYISGIDTFGEISSVSRSDVNMVATVNPKTKQILLTSIPRDYYVKLHTYKAYDKLTHAGMYGVEESIQTIEDLLNIDINYYIKVNFTSVVDIVNALGGLKVYSDYGFTSEDGFTYSKGYNNMNGEEALSFARERHSFQDGDRQRVKDQQAVLTALIKKACSKSILTKYSSLLKSLEGEFDTSLSSRKIKSLVKMQLNDMATWTITSVSLNGFDGHDVTYSGGSQVLYVMEPDESTVSETSELIKSVINGKKLKGSYEYSGKSSSVSRRKKSINSDTNNTTQTQEEEAKKETNDNKSVPADVSCQSGYTLSNDKTVCTKVENEEPKYSCQSGEITDEYCVVVVCTLLDDPTCEDTCKDGEMENGKCVKKTQAQGTCSDGFTYSNGKCSKVDSVSPSYSCPTGYALSGKVCTK